jgi:hypothetical protein
MPYIYRQASGWLRRPDWLPRGEGPIAFLVAIDRPPPVLFLQKQEAADGWLGCSCNEISSAGLGPKRDRLQGLAADEARQIADDSHRIAHQ